MILGKHITVIIPALNEADSIGRVISDIPENVDKIVVVDNGSDDNTGAIASAYGVCVVYQPVRGYGAACLAGIHSLHKTDLVAFIDGDYSDYPEELLNVIEPVAGGEFDFAIGWRRNRLSNSVELPVHQRWGNWLACCLIQLLHGFRYYDLGPMRCISRELLEHLEMTDTNYGWTAEMQLKVSKLGLKIIQVPVRYRRRIGKSKISGTLKGTVMSGLKIFYWTIRVMFLDLKAFNPR
jgi:glycosyltransferase involved in cell wall biosynthesis